MPSTLLATAALVVSLHTGPGNLPASIAPSADTTIHSHANSKSYDKGKGTVGLISGLLLGPVGLGGVYLFSHNRAQRRAAKKGCAIFGAVVVTAALCWLLILGAKNLGNFGSGGSNHSGSSGSGSSGGSGRSGGSSGSGGSMHGGSGHSGGSGSWAGNFNFPDFGSSSPSTKKKPAAAQPAVDLPPKIFWKY